ncbi:unnamed protein product [Blepharisma stoltei]|uniref:Uncharacterized protein n=1 Tax=Blepharisma stoltei TaxID=1481888 RepID=A0AAU9JL47_9CILI|nr:unnamed protein product [Blepharisma stoltei]
MGLIEGWFLFRSEKKHDVKIDNVVCKLDSVKASQPIQKLASLEYLRALKEHSSYHEKQSKSLSDSVEYAIDKAVRERMQQGLFGYDHSQLIVVEMELQKNLLKEKGPKSPEAAEALVNRMLLEKLEASEKQNPGRKLDYENWKRKKDAEGRLKKKLTSEVLGIEKEQEIIEINEKMTHEAESSKKVKEWARAKRKEERQKRREKLIQEKIVEESKNKKREEANAHYREWLRDSLMKLKEQKKRERAERKTKAALEREIERQKEENKIKAELAYQEWLINKLSKTEPNTPEIYPEPKIKKPTMLAYSPNKQKIPVIQNSYDEYSESITENIEYSDYSDEEEEESIPIVSSQKPPRHNANPLQMQMNQHRVDDNHTFEDLSSIRRSPHVIDAYQNEQEVSESSFEGSSYEEN